MKHDSADARAHPIVAAFVELVDRRFANGTPDFHSLLEPDFMPFWKNLIIARWDGGQGDFRIVLYGSFVAEIFGKDHTGRWMSEMEFGEAEDMVRAMNKDVLDSGERAYADDTVFWQNRDHAHYYQVKMPLLRKGQINEVLVCMTSNAEM